MKVCPIAIVSGCPKCPVFKVCPAKGLLGGYVEPPKQASSAGSSASRKD